MGVSKEELSSYDLQAMVISRNSMGSGLAYHPLIPILSERLLGYVIGWPHHKSLRSAWRVGTGQEWKVIDGVHYKKRDFLVKFGSYMFICKGLGHQSLKRWQPELGFSFTA